MMEEEHRFGMWREDQFQSTFRFVNTTAKRQLVWKHSQHHIAGLLKPRLHSCRMHMARRYHARRQVAWDKMMLRSSRDLPSLATCRCYRSELRREEIP